MRKRISLGEYKFELKIKRRIKDEKGRQLRKVVLEKVQNRKLRVEKEENYKE